MHNAALAAAGLTDWTYQRLPLPPDVFAETIRHLPEMGFVGVNVTIPHKEAALGLADRATDSAAAIGAANTLTFNTDGTTSAENTDAPGFLAALPEAAQGRSALVLGAGGSARAVVWALLQAGASEVRVWNRTAERAQQLCRDIGASHAEEPSAADLLVNCTSIGLHGEPLEALPISLSLLAEFQVVADLVYAPGGTPLISTAAQAGAKVVDGLEILVRQGALSFEHWTGHPPDLDVMRSAAREGDDG